MKVSKPLERTLGEFWRINTCLLSCCCFLSIKPRIIRQGSPCIQTKGRQLIQQSLYINNNYMHKMTAVINYELQVWTCHQRCSSTERAFVLPRVISNANAFQDKQFTQLPFNHQVSNNQIRTSMMLWIIPGNRFDSFILHLIVLWNITILPVDLGVNGSSTPSSNAWQSEGWWKNQSKCTEHSDT